MKDLIDIIAEGLRDNDERDNILMLVESLYFTKAKRSFWRPASPGSKELTRIANDLVNLENSIRIADNIKDVKIRSQLIDQAIEKGSKGKMYKDIRTRVEVTTSQRDFLLLEVIKPNRSYVTAVMLAELIFDEKRRIRYQQWLTFLLPVCTAIITAMLTRFWK